MLTLFYCEDEGDIFLRNLGVFLRNCIRFNPVYIFLYSHRCENFKSNIIVTDLLKAFLGNGSVNTFRRATMEDMSQWTNVIARCYGTASAPMNSLARNHMTCVPVLSVRSLYNEDLLQLDQCRAQCSAVLIKAKEPRRVWVPTFQGDWTQHGKETL
jgi:hypothetical protein